MKYLVEALDKETEFLAFEVDLPDGCDTELAAIMNWTSAQRGRTRIRGSQQCAIQNKYLQTIPVIAIVPLTAPLFSGLTEQRFDRLSAQVLTRFSDSTSC